MATVTVHEAKTHLSKLIARALAGEDVVIARGKEPTVRLVPVQEVPRPRRQFGTLKGLVSLDDRFWEPLPDEDMGWWPDDARL